MFSFLKKEDLTIVSPVDGNLIPLDQVNDAVFAQKLMGDGVAFQPTGDTIYAPCSGQVVMIATTKHAIGLKNQEGIELLIHIGLDTVNLQGKGFTCLVNDHDKIKKGQPLLRLDRSIFDAEQIDLTTPMIITNANGCSMTITSNTGEVHNGDKVMTYRKP